VLKKQEYTSEIMSSFKKLFKAGHCTHCESPRSNMGKDISASLRLSKVHGPLSPRDGMRSNCVLLQSYGSADVFTTRC
jgi:hypothetical protein